MQADVKANISPEPTPADLDKSNPLEGPTNRTPESEPASLTIADHDSIKRNPKWFTTDNEEDDWVVHTWRIRNWHALQQKDTGPVFYGGSDGYPYRILLFPQGNNGADMTSIYVEMADPKGQATGGPPGPIIKDAWHTCAEFAIGASNPNDSSVFHIQNARHRFSADAADWGFQHFCRVERPVPSTRDPTVAKPLLEGDSIDLHVFMRFIKDETGVLWHNFVNYDSKKETGYVGLKNQGATCYMNSLLQSLYCTPYFRRAVYDIPTGEDEDPQKSVALALQRVFYSIQTSNTAVGTTELTKSFGWDTLDAFMQHDVQEFNRVLQDNLEGKMKGTPADGAISRLFVGKMKSYIKCVNVPYESARHEDYYDIQLNVKNCKTLEDSFKDYIAEETLEGENKYHAEGYGLQDAKKGIVFESFPPVLHLQLKRFEYDMEKDAQVKINDRLAFPMKIDLKDYLSDAAKKEGDWNYCLHGVLVHSGDLGGGHYFALLKPEKDSRWLRFDDDRVTYVTEREVLEENYGEDAPPPQPGLRSSQRHTVKRFTNAYMLVYVRECKRDVILKTVADEDIPLHLKQRIEDERRREEELRREREEQHLYYTFRMVTDETFRDHQGFDLAAFDDRREQRYQSMQRHGSQYHVTQPNPPILPPPPEGDRDDDRPATGLLRSQKEMISFRFKSSAAVAQLLRALAREYGVSPKQLRIRSFINRQNRTVRPDAPMLPEDYDKSLEELREKPVRSHDWKFYLEMSYKQNSDGTWFPPRNGYDGNHILIFGKYYDPKEGKMTGTGHFYIARDSKVGDMCPTLAEMAGLPPNTPLKLYEEIKQGMLEPPNKKFNVVQAELVDGDIMCYQKDLPDKELKDYEMPTVTSYFEMISFRVDVLFKPKPRQPGSLSLYESILQMQQSPQHQKQREQQSGQQRGNEQEFELVLQRRMTYEDVVAKLAQRLGVDDPLKIRLTAPENRPVNRNVTLNDMLQSGMYGLNVPRPFLNYEVLNYSVAELESKTLVKVEWLGSQLKEQGYCEVLLPRNAEVRRIAETLHATLLDIAKSAPADKPVQVPPVSRISLYCVDNGRIVREFTGSDQIHTVRDWHTLYAEELPQEDQTDGKTVHVVHFNKEPSRMHGVPFRFTLYRNEKFVDTRARLRARMGMSDKDFAKVRVCWLESQPGNSSLRVRDLEDDCVLFDCDPVSTHHYLGVDHPEKKRAVGVEKAVKIFN